MQKPDFSIIGAGIIGLTIGRQLLIENPGLKVLVIDKENLLAEHASGRNSGVIHAGFYYSPDTLKAQLTRNGNLLLHRFIEERNLPIRKSGKVVVTQSEEQLSTLNELYKRGQANGVPLEVITDKELFEIEPFAKTVGQALWSPTTSVSDPSQVTNEVANNFIEMGGEILRNTEVLRIEGSKLYTTEGEIDSGHVINAAGLYADVFARQAGANDDYVMMPFKGLYWYAPSLKGQLNSHIYPVPNIENPFLGVHYTVTVSGDVKVGPTAIPALWREDYGGLTNAKLSESIQIASRYPRFLTSKHHNVPKLITSELPKYNRNYLLRQAAGLAPEIPAKAFTKKGRPGVRAQLLEKSSGRLEMDFVLRHVDKSTHVLNAVSPAWTSSFAVAQHVVQSMKSNKIL